VNFARQFVNVSKFSSGSHTPTPSGATSDATSSSNFDQMVMAGFFQNAHGEYCIQGGADDSWWHYEYCHRKNVTQFHRHHSGDGGPPELDARTTTVLLGAWDEKLHKKWLLERNEKRPKKPPMGMEKHLQVSKIQVTLQ